MQMYYANRIGEATAFIAAFLVLLVAAWMSIRFALADAAFRKATPASVAQAISLLPGNTEYLLARALQIEYDGGDPTAILERAAVLNPLSSAPRIRLGLAAEIHDQPVVAERWLLEAASVDRQFEARWTLANFYFRHDRLPEFWTWIRQALAVSYGDRRRSFDLCWRASEDPAEILRLAIPTDHGVVAAYLGYLLENKRVAAIGPVALKLTAMGDGNDRPALLAACDALIEAGDSAEAKALWAAMGFPKLAGVVNPDFEVPEVGHGFDWRLSERPGLVHTELDQPRTMHRIALNGSQPESCELLRQILILEPQAGYTLHWQARTNGLSSPTGIEWRIAGASAAVPASPSGAEGELDFTAPAELVPLVLYYTRPSGEPRAEGSVELWHVTIEKR